MIFRCPKKNRNAVCCLRTHILSGRRFEPHWLARCFLSIIWCSLTRRTGGTNAKCFISRCSKRTQHTVFGFQCSAFRFVCSCPLRVWMLVCVSEPLSTHREMFTVCIDIKERFASWLDGRLGYCLHMYIMTLGKHIGISNKTTPRFTRKWGAKSFCMHKRRVVRSSARSLNGSLKWKFELRRGSS